MIKVLTDSMHFTWNNYNQSCLKVFQNQSDRFSLEELTHNVNGKSIKGSNAKCPSMVEFTVIKPIYQNCANNKSRNGIHFVRAE